MSKELLNLEEMLNNPSFDKKKILNNVRAGIIDVLWHSLFCPELQGVSLKLLYAFKEVYIKLDNVTLSKKESETDEDFLLESDIASHVLKMGKVLKVPSDFNIMMVERAYKNIATTQELYGKKYIENSYNLSLTPQAIEELEYLLVEEWELPHSQPDIPETQDEVKEVIEEKIEEAEEELKFNESLIKNNESLKELNESLKNGIEFKTPENKSELQKMKQNEIELSNLTEEINKVDKLPQGKIEALKTPENEENIETNNPLKYAPFKEETPYERMMRLKKESEKE